VTLGGRRVAIERPRVRSVDGQTEVRLRTYAHFADRDSLARSVLERMLAGVSTRRYRRTQEPVGAEVEQAARSTSRSSVSRAFIERTRLALRELMSRRLDDVRLAVMMIDGLELQGRTNVVALGITSEGVKIPPVLWQGSTENATLATALLSDLVERGLDPQARDLVRDRRRQGAPQRLRPGARAAVSAAQGAHLLDHLPERERPAVKQQLRRAWALEEHARALDQLRQLVRELERTYPGAAGSPREGMEETLTLTRLGVTGSLKRTLESTNPCESMIEIVRRTQRNVKRWSSGEMALRWTAAGMLEAERQFRKIIGYRDLATSPSRPNATMIVAITPSTPLAPRPRRPLSRHRLTVTAGPPPKSTKRGTSSSATEGAG
jgi:putative transposase